MSSDTTRELATASGLTVTEIRRPKPPNGKEVPRTASAYVDVEVDIDADDLHEQGWHHENECPVGGLGMPIAAPASLALGWTTVTAALESLHCQAHGPGPVALCRSEPCCSLSLDQIRGAA